MSNKKIDVRIIFWILLICLIILIYCFENFKKCIYFCLLYKNAATIVPIPNAYITDAQINSECKEVITREVIIV